MTPWFCGEGPRRDDVRGRAGLWPAVEGRAWEGVEVGTDPVTHRGDSGVHLRRQVRDRRFFMHHLQVYYLSPLTFLALQMQRATE